jgi:hypothetical protein
MVPLKTDHGVLRHLLDEAFIRAASLFVGVAQVGVITADTYVIRAFRITDKVTTPSLSTVIGTVQA